jgi:DNA primase
LRASVRGIDLILKKECKGLYFPDGEDRTVLLRKHPHDDLVAYLENNDFIQLKHHFDE